MYFGFRVTDETEIIVSSVYFDTYIVKDMTDTEIIPGRVVEHIALPGAVGATYSSIVSAVTHYLREPFSLDPRDWEFQDGVIIIDALSSTVATNYADSRKFVRTPTSNGIALWEKGKKDLYLVRCEITLGVLSPITADLAQSEGIST